ncbi:MAG: ABC transporter permease [Planctomycetes bacterium]|nr:ABC transporter permease [Planctomycetota bacterium]
MAEKTAAARSGGKNRYVAGLRNVIGILVAFVALFIILSVITNSFLTSQNLFNVTRQITVNMFLTCGMTFVILTGGIDLSVGSIIAVAGCLAGGMITRNGMNVGVAILIGIAAGTLIGAFNGLVISRTRIPAFIVTLAVMNICRGFVRIYTNTKTIMVDNEIFAFIGTGKIFGNVPVHILYVIVICIAAALILYRTRFGRHVYAIGDNEMAAVYTGINVRKVKFLTFVLSGFFASCAGILSSARTHSALFNVGEGAEMDAIASVVLGGTSMTGGVGGIGGSIIGALVIGILGNGMNLLGIGSSWKYVVKGAILLLAVYIDFVRKNKE